MVIDPELSLRIPAVLLSIAAGSVMLLTLIGKWRPFERYSPRTTVGLFSIAMITSLFFVIFPTSSARSDLVYSAREIWYRALEPNVLARYVLLEDHNPDISIPIMSEGTIITEDNPDDLHVDLDSRSVIYMCEVPLSKEQLARIVAARQARLGREFRVFLWFDESSPKEDQAAVVELIASAGVDSIYQVVTINSGARREDEYGAIVRDSKTESLRPSERMRTND